MNSSTAGADVTMISKSFSAAQQSATEVKSTLAPKVEQKRSKFSRGFDKHQKSSGAQEVESSA